MKNSVLILLALFAFDLANAQYYYNDIQGAKDITAKMKSYAANKVQTVTSTGYDPRGSKSTDFNEWQEINAATHTLKVSTRNGQEVTRQYYIFDAQDRLSSIIDSSRGVKSTTSYTYNAANNIALIRTVINDSMNGFKQTEDHQWLYNAGGKLEKMWRIVDGKDSMEYRFTVDEKGNVVDEQLYRRGQSVDVIYFYYDDNNRLTDIVRYNKKMKALLPDVMFEYDEQNRVIQKITPVSFNNPSYLIWRYVFDAKGLKTKEALFNKDKALTGRIDYAYTFRD